MPHVLFLLNLEWYQVSATGMYGTYALGKFMHASNPPQDSSVNLYTPLKNLDEVIFQVQKTNKSRHCR